MIFKINRTQTLKKLKDRYLKKEGLEQDSLSWMFEGKEVKDNDICSTLMETEGVAIMNDYRFEIYCSKMM